MYELTYESNLSETNRKNSLVHNSIKKKVSPILKLILTWILLCVLLTPFGENKTKGGKEEEKGSDSRSDWQTGDATY